MSSLQQGKRNNYAYEYAHTECIHIDTHTKEKTWKERKEAEQTTQKKRQLRVKKKKTRNSLFFFFSRVIETRRCKEKTK